MPEKHFNQPPNLKNEVPLSLLFGFIFMFAVLLALPVSQWITSIRDRTKMDVEVIEMKPPTLMDQPPPPEEPPPEDDIEDVQQEREPPTLEQLELSMNADLSGLTSSSFTVPTIDVGSQIEELVYELSDLTRAPRPIKQPQPIYPPELRRAGIEGTVILMFHVRSDGTTAKITVQKSDNPGFNEPTIRAVRKWRFQPGEKDGKPVTCRVRIPIPFKVN